MRNPLAVLAPRRFGSVPSVGRVPTPRRVPAPDTLPGVEFLEHGCTGEGEDHAPEVSVRGFDLAIIGMLTVSAIALAIETFV